ncbi:MAG: helix-turn-helix transcriptional regulator [Alicyclobacillus macrosporangiidus]|uniref:helix-turn-helix transcriptional regulator n=1 Tax=Alicyclobacillus macrosporangiidus TaxID=392015 RepID=UPI0026EBDDC1|nr:helix-turn-helix transcriptional regulator [Alicyclobacillus macrosporangiidus]MCL6599528.1 helix-turn-helix transcriptional regulator [Alicyclobacillus macrosporangiidus]
MKNRLRQVRRFHDETQEELAKAVGVSRQAISSIENERVVPNGALMIAIARHYGMNVTDIFDCAPVKHVEQINASA